MTMRSRAETVRRVLSEGQSPKAVATAFGVDAKTSHRIIALIGGAGSLHGAAQCSDPAHGNIRLVIQQASPRRLIV